MRLESPNGGAERWLAGSEGAAVDYLSMGKSCEERGSFSRSVAFIQGGERGWCGPQSGFEWWHESEGVSGALFTDPAH
jgi:hypothetical protein